MTLVVVLAVLMILVGFIRALQSREASGDAQDETEGVDAPEDAPDDASPEEPARASAPPWEVYPDAQWKLKEVKPAIWKGGAPPSMMEMFERVPESGPDAPTDGWVMPEPDPTLMENPEDYGIDNGDPNTPMWTPPDLPPVAPQLEESPRKRGTGIFVFACVFRIVFDALYLFQYALVLGNNGKGFYPSKFKLDIPGGVETVVFVAGMLLLMDVLLLALFVRQSRWIRVAFLIYLLFDAGLRAINFMNGLLVGGSLMDGTLLGVTLAASYDLVCALYILRPSGTLEVSD